MKLLEMLIHNQHNVIVFCMNMSILHECQYRLWWMVVCSDFRVQAYPSYEALNSQRTISIWTTITTISPISSLKCSSSGASCISRTTFIGVSQVVEEYGAPIISHNTINFEASLILVWFFLIYIWHTFHRHIGFHQIHRCVIVDVKQALDFAVMAIVVIFKRWKNMVLPSSPITPSILKLLWFLCNFSLSIIDTHHIDKLVSIKLANSCNIT